jgi:hypothetical protein
MAYPETFAKFHAEFGGPRLSGEDGIVLVHARIVADGRGGLLR